MTEPPNIAAPAASLLQRPIPWISRRPRRWGAILAAIVAAAYVAGLSSEWFIGHDSGLYLCLARNIAAGLGYTLAGEPSAHVPPGFPMMLAGLMRLGAGSFLALNCVMLAMGLATAAVTCLLLRELVHRDWAMVLTAAAALTVEMTQRSGEILSDVPFALLVLTALWLYARGLRGKRGDWLGPSSGPCLSPPLPCRGVSTAGTGTPSQTTRRRASPLGGWEVASLLLIAACWLRMAGFPLAVGAAVGLAVAGWRRARTRSLVNAALVLAGIGATYLIYKHAASTAATAYAGIAARAGSKTALALVAGWFEHMYVSSGQLSRLYFAQRLPLWLAVPTLFGPLLLAMAARIRRGDAVGPLALACYVGGTAVFMTMIRTRYLMPLLPLLLLYLVEGYALIAAWIARRWPRSAIIGKAFVLAILPAVLVLNLPLVGRTIYQKHRGDWATAQQRGEYRDEVRAAAVLGQLPPGTRILADYPLAYLTGSDRPIISRERGRSIVDGAEAEGVIESLRVRYVALDVRDLDPDDADTRLERSLMDHLRRTRTAIFASGELRVYDLATLPAATLPAEPP